MSAVNDSISPGDVQFFDNFVPALEADDYTIAITQTVHSSDASHPLDQTFSATQTFSVVAPRFALPAADVQSVFPPANSTGIFDQNLAHVVLNQRVLPWERLIVEGDEATKGTPWMALLLLTEDEIVPPAGVVQPSATTNPTLAGSYPVTPPTAGADSLVTPSDPATLGPNVSPEATDEQTCQAIDITTAVFEQVAPLQAELPFLAHVREVGDVMESKSTDQAAGDGWFSVTIGNRFPTSPGAGSTGGTLNIAHLVSLEGFWDYLVPNPAWPAGKTKVRLASLASWSFTSLAEVGDFASLANHLVASPIASIAVVQGGTGYTSAPEVGIAGDGGAQAVAVVANGAVSAIALVDAGDGYSSPPAITLTGGGGSGAQAQAALVSQGGDVLRLRLPFTPATVTPGSPAAFAQTALENGYSALAYDTRVGDATFGWYHGPFVPNPVEAFSQGQPFASAAAATIYDSTTGTFDLTYAAAWEMGRMLTLTARSQSTAKMALSKALRSSVNLLRERTRTRGVQSTDALAPEVSGAALSAKLEPRGQSKSLVSWMGSDLSRRLPVPGAKAYAAARREAGTVTDLRAHVPAAAHLRAMAARPNVQAMLSVRLTAIVSEPQFSLAVDWLAGLRLLEGVSFNGLVPNAAMLPAESIRFFYVDPNYLNALSDGANSIGVQTTRDQAQNLAVRGTLRQAAVARAHTLRPRRIGRAKSGAATAGARATAAAGANATMSVAPGETGASQPGQPNDPVCGLLLRSALVSGWPGLEVKAYAAVQAGRTPLEPVLSSLIAPLRFDRLAPDVLLCLYPQIPVWIELDEPKEGLAFGVEDPAQPGGSPRVALRSIDNSTGNMGLTTGTDVALTSTYLRDPATGVINIGSWQAYLAAQFTASSTKWGPAAFALQMVRAPEQMIFQIQPNPAPSEISEKL